MDELHPTHVILAHTGGWKQWDQVIELLTDPALYFDISFSLGVITPEQFMTIVGQHGSDHLLFGTDTPGDTAAHTLEELKKRLNHNVSVYEPFKSGDLKTEDLFCS